MRGLKIILMTVLLPISVCCLYAQGLGNKAVGKPDVFHVPYPGVNIGKMNEMLTRYWVVYSDRDNNSTYTRPGGSEVFKTIGFMEEFKVAEISSNYLHIYKETKASPTYPVISPSAVDYGWISMDNLLLWQHCYQDLVTHIDKKAMVLNTFEGTTNVSLDNQALSFMKDPGLRINSGNKARLFEILFIYKQTDNAVLLGEDIAIQGNEIDVASNIRGWVPIQSVTFWDSRITLEPNWEQAAAQERSVNNIVPTVFLDEKAAMDYKAGAQVNQRYVIWENDPGAKRNIGQWRRFPILEVRNNNVYRIGAMGKIRTSSGAIMDEERMSEIRNAIDVLEEKTRKINVVFVVDGTESMGRFYAPIARGIEKSVNNLRRDDTQNRFSFGAVIYRDFAEGENLVQVKPLTENHKAVTDFFLTASTAYSNDTDLPEALFYGLKTALNMVGLKNGESNFIILIGDCGSHERNDPSFVPFEDVVDLLSQFECSLISYQVNNGYPPAYQDFITQSRQIIKQSAIKINNIRETEKKKWIKENTSFEAPYFESTGPNRYSLNPQEVVGSYLFPGIGQSLPYEILETEIVDKIDEFDNRISQLLAKAKGIIRGAGIAGIDSGEADEFQPAVVDFLSKIAELSDSEIAFLKNKNYQFSMKGYTAKEINGLSYPIYKEVLFLSLFDLVEVVTRLNSLCDYSGSMSERRIRMQNVWVEILASILGSDKRNEIMNMKGSDLHNVVFGLPAQSELITDVKLRDIVERTVISDAQFEQYVQYLSFKLGELRKIVNEVNYEQSFRSNNIVYYWIPLETFP
jgi:hypothetical protein